MSEVARVKSRWMGFTGSPGWSTFHFTKTSIVGWDFFAPRMVTHIDNMFDAGSHLFPTPMSIETLGDIDIIDSDNSEILYTVSTTSATTSGAGTVNQGPSPTGMVLAWRTAGVVKGKHVRGRTFLVPVDYAAIDYNGTPTANANTYAAAMVTAMLDVGEPNLHPCIYSRPRKDKTSGAITTPGTAWTITRGTVKDEFAVLRTRRD